MRLKGKLFLKIIFVLLFFEIKTECTLQKTLVIITASYNNTTWCKQYFDSIINQEYDNWILFYIDDNSTDDTYEQMKQLIQLHNVEDKVILIKNPERRGHLHNQYHAIHACDKNHIIVILDGDDWLANNHVLETINTAYSDENIWLTYGQFWYLKKNKKGFCRPIPPDVIQKNTLREISWRTSHLRTFYAGLFQAIKYEDLLYQGAFFPKCADVATMFPMIEMAGTHIKYIPDILYIYNDDNPISFHYDPSQQREIEAFIRTMPRYLPLKEKLW